MRESGEVLADHVTKGVPMYAAYDLEFARTLVELYRGGVPYNLVGKLRRVCPTATINHGLARCVATIVRCVARGAGAVHLLSGAAVRATVVVLIGVEILLLSIGTSARAASLPTATVLGSHVVLAYYYAWWEPEKISAALFTPTQRFPSGIRQLADDPALLREHIQEAEAAGIDGFIVNRVSDMAILLPLARDANFSVTLHLDPAYGVASQVRAFYTYIDDSAVVRYQGHPVLFFWQAQASDNDVIAALRQEVDPDHNVLWIADGDKFGILRGDVWDGISPYATAWSGNPSGQLTNWASQARANAPGKLYIPPVSPGCDDHLARKPTCVQDRSDGAYYRAAWQGALALKSVLGSCGEHLQRVDGVHSDRAECPVRRPVPGVDAAVR